MYAIRALELLGDDAAVVRESIARARKNRYEFTRRIARRLTRKLSGR